MTTNLLTGTAYHGVVQDGERRVLIFDSPRGMMKDLVPREERACIDWGVRSAGTSRLAFLLIAHVEGDAAAATFCDIFATLVLEHVPAAGFTIEAAAVRAIVEGLREARRPVCDASKVERLVDENVYRLTS